MSESCKKELSGVSIRNLPPEISPEQAQTFLETVGLPPGHTDISTNKLKYSTTVNVEGLEAEECCSIIAKIEGTTAFDRKVFCRGIIENLEEDNVKNDNPGAKKVDPDSKEEVAEQETPTSAPSTASKPSSQQSPKVDIPGLNLSKSQEKKRIKKKMKTMFGNPSITIQFLMPKRGLIMIQLTRKGMQLQLT